MVHSAHNLLRLYLTVPVMSATSERTFSALKCVLTSLRSSMTEKPLNNCLILYIHKDLTDALDIKSQAEELASCNQEKNQVFWQIRCYSAIAINSTTIVFTFVS